MKKISEIQNLEDNDLVDLIKRNKNIEKCLSVLISRHSALCVDVINGYMSKSPYQALRQELINEKDYTIYQSALKFNPDKKTKFSSFIANEMKWRCLNSYNKIKKEKSFPAGEELINYLTYKQNDGSVDNNDFFKFIIDRFNSHPDSRVGRIFRLRYIEGKNNTVMPWKNISKHLGLSIQGCINIHDLALNNMKHRIRKEINE